MTISFWFLPVLANNSFEYLFKSFFSIKDALKISPNNKLDGWCSVLPLIIEELNLKVSLLLLLIFCNSADIDGCIKLIQKKAVVSNFPEDLTNNVMVLINGLILWAF